MYDLYCKDHSFSVVLYKYYFGTYFFLVFFRQQSQTDLKALQRRRIARHSGHHQRWPSIRSSLHFEVEVAPVRDARLALSPHKLGTWYQISACAHVPHCYEGKSLFRSKNRAFITVVWRYQWSSPPRRAGRDRPWTGRRTKGVRAGSTPLAQVTHASILASRISPDCRSVDQLSEYRTAKQALKGGGGGWHPGWLLLLSNVTLLTP